MSIELMTANAICEMLQISRITFDRLRKEGIIKHAVQIGRRFRYNPQHVKWALEAHSAKPKNFTVKKVFFKASNVLSSQEERPLMAEAIDDAVKESFMFGDGLPLCGYVEITRTEVIHIPNSNFTQKQLQAFADAERQRQEDAKGHALVWLRKAQGDDEELEVIGVAKDVYPTSTSSSDDQAVDSVEFKGVGITDMQSLMRMPILKEVFPIDLTQCLTVDEACHKLGMTEHQFGKLLNEGKIKPVGYIGCHMRFDPDTINDH